MFHLMLSLLIREMGPDDVGPLKEVYFKTRSQAFNWLNKNEIGLDDFEADTEGERIWVAVLEEKVVGFISAWEPENFIHHLFVLPEYFGQQIGSKLLSVCMQNIGRPAKLKCVSENVKALQFYRSRGWYTVSLGSTAEGEYQLMQANEI